MIKTYFFFMIGLCLLCGCENDISTPVNRVPNTIEMFQYKVGNMWIYEVTINPEDSTLFPTFASDDTINVLGDTFIRGNNYKKVRKKEFGSTSFHFYRDSVGNLINSFGKIIFSMVNHGTIYNHNFEVLGKDTLYEYFDISNGVLMHTAVPLGGFETYNLQRFIIIPTKSDKIKRTAVSSFAPGIGLVSYENFFLGSKRGNITWKLKEIRI